MAAAAIGAARQLARLANPAVTASQILPSNGVDPKARYEALRFIKLLVDDELDGVEKEMTVWFANDNKPHIRSVRF